MAQRRDHHRLGTCGLLGALAFAAPALALDVTRPAEVAGLAGERTAADVALSWSAVTLDAAGQPEVVDHYNVYRGQVPDFVPDTAGGTNRIGSPLGTTFTDVGAAANGLDYYYLVTAVDAAGHESNSAPPLVTAPPVLTGFWTDTTIEVDWTGAAPLVQVASYRVYYGRSSGQYESVVSVGLADSHSLAGLQTFVNWYVAVTAVDAHGNESAFSNEHIDAVAGVVKLRFHDDDDLCWEAVDCTPADPAKIQRNDGFQLLVPGHFPEGDWVSTNLTFTVASNLCTPPAQGTVSKCGSNNPCVSPPCNGNPAYNPCGDPWDRLGQVFVVLDDCVERGGNCITQSNLEIARIVTPFGTDAPPPNGTGVVDPRVYRVDVTPLTPLLTGDRYVGVEIVHFVQMGWSVTVDFTFSERPAHTSPKPPADGIAIVGLGGAPLPARTVSIPLEAKQVKARIFTTGHGGSTFCDGGTNNAQPCTAQVQCPGGVCNPCDEFCHRTNRLRANGTPIWSVVPFRTDCSPSGNPCSNWNACGFPSCTFPRAGWCPGYLACHHNAPCDNDIDLTGQLPPGASYDLDYVVEPQNGFWPVSVVLYWYE